MKIFIKNALLLMALAISNIGFSCTPYGVPTISANIVGTTLNLTVTSWTTWGCNYAYEGEIVCASGAYTGVPDFTSPGTVTGSGSAYPVLAIDISGYCPGNYKLRVREKVSTYSSAGPWSAWSVDYNFTVAGASLTVSASASPSSICFPGNSTLTATPSNACGSITYTWDNGAGTGQTVNVSPSGTTTYTVTATDAASCVTVTDAVTVTAAPAAVAGTASIAPANICEGATTTLSLTGEVGSIQWQSGPTAAGPWTDIPGATTDPYVVGPMNVSDDAFFQAVVTSCGSQTSNVVSVVVSPAPVIDAGSPQTVCDGTTITVSGSGGVSYAWTGGVTNGVAFTPPVGTTTYTVTGTDANGCVNTDAVDITVNPLPAINAGVDQAVCDGATVTLSGSGGVTYAWSGGITNGVAFTPTIGTTNYTLTGTDANGCINTDNVNVTAYSLPPINAGTDQTVCDGDPVTLSGAGGVSYVWTGGVTNGIAFTPTVGTTTYTITGTDANGCVNTDDVDVNVNALPTILAGADQTVCDGTNVTLSGSGGTSYAWSGGITDGVAFTPIVGTTTYTVTGTDANGCVNTDNVDVIVNALPAISAGPDQTVCDGLTVTLSGSGGVSYVWTGSITDGVAFTPTVGTTTYTVTGTDANGCVNTDDADVTANPLDDPSFNYTSGLTHCITGPNPVTNITGLSGGSFTHTVISGGPTLDLNGSTGEITLANSDIGVYNITYNTTGAPGSLCPQQSSLTLTISDAPVADFFIDDFCSNDLDPLPTFIGTGSAGVFSSTPGLVINSTTGEIDLDASTVGTYTVTNTINIPGCALVTFDDDMTIFGLPDATISGTTSICIENPLPDLTVDITAGVPDWSFTYNFNGGPVTVNSVSTSPHTISGAAIGTYDLVSITDGNGCTNTISGQAVISLNPAPVLNPLSNYDVCQGNSLNIVAFGTNIPNSTYSWTNLTGTDIGFGLSGNGNIAGFTALNPSGTDETVTVEVTPTSDLGCLGTPMTFTVSSHPLPTVLFVGGPLVDCEPSTVTFDNQSTFATGSCSWNFGDGSIGTGCGTVSNIYSAGVYDVSLTVTSAFGCVASDTYDNYITVNELPVASFGYSPQQTTVENTLVEFTNTSINATSYTWNFGDQSADSNTESPSHQFPSAESGEYLVTLIAINGTPTCADTAQALIIIDDVIIFYVPNIFTPDGDNFNEIFKPVFTSGYDPYDFHLMIFNRWGELVFESFNAAVGWDGTYSDQGLVQDGTYIWKIEFKETMSDKRHKHTGHVTVLK